MDRVWHNPSSHVSLCNLYGSNKVLCLLKIIKNYCVVCGRKWFSCQLTTSSLVLWLFGRSMSKMLFINVLNGLLKSIDVLDNSSILSLLSQVTVDRWKYSLYCERFSELQLLVQCTFNSSKSFQKFMFCFKSFFFFLHDSQPAGPNMKKMSSKEK